jgi:two-component system response regulator AtoC
MAATHRNLERAIVDRTFREDLYYRLNVINLHVPPLRERKEDVLAIAQFLIQKHSVKDVPAPQISPELKNAMTSYQWPGNVRELENFVRKFMIFRDSASLAQELQAKITRKPLIASPVVEANPAAEGSVENAPILEQVTKAKEQAETDAILAALNSTRWNRKQAAALLKIDYKALLYKMKKLGVEDAPVSALGGGEHTPKTMVAHGD